MTDTPDVESLICPHCTEKQMRNMVGGGIACLACGKESTLEEIMAATVTLSMTTLGMGAVQLHEGYLEYNKAGFTERQSLYIMMCLVTGNPGQAPKEV